MRRVIGNRARLGAPALFAGILAACSSPMRVSTEYDQTADFSKVHSFAWAPGADAAGDAARKIRPATSERIRSEVARTLGEKGIREAPAASADMLVGFGVVLDAVAEKVVAPGTPGTGASGRPARQDWVYHYDLGTLTVDLTDRASSRPLWRGAAQAEVQKESAGEKVKEAVTKMFADFPPSTRR